MASRDDPGIVEASKSQISAQGTRAVVDDGGESEALGGCGRVLAFFSFILVILFFPFSLISSVKVRVWREFC